MRSFLSIPFFVTVLVTSAARFSIADPSIAAIQVAGQQRKQLLRQRTTTSGSSIFAGHSEPIHQLRKLRKLDDNNDDDDSWFRNAAGQILWWIWLLVVIAASVVLFCIVYCCCMATCCGLCYLKKQQQDNENKAETASGMEAAQALPATTVAAPVATTAPVAEPYVAEPYVAEPYVAPAAVVPPKQAEHSDDGFATGFQD